MGPPATSPPWYFAANKTEASLDPSTSNSSEVFGEVELVGVASSSVRVHPIVLCFVGEKSGFYIP